MTHLLPLGAHLHPFCPPSSLSAPPLTTASPAWSAHLWGELSWGPRLRPPLWQSGPVHGTARLFALRLRLAVSVVQSQPWGHIGFLLANNPISLSLPVVFNLGLGTLPFRAPGREGGMPLCAYFYCLLPFQEKILF
jgi:hypothetical protein